MRLLVIALISLLPIVAHASERIALVIGHADYQTASLKNPVNDARSTAGAAATMSWKDAPSELARR